MEGSVTVNEIALALVYRDQASEAAVGAGVNYYARQIRNWAAQAILTPSGVAGPGRTSAREFTRDDIFKAAVLTTLTAVGLSGAQLKAALAPAEGKLWEAAKRRIQSRRKLLGHRYDDNPVYLHIGFTDRAVLRADLGLLPSPMNAKSDRDETWAAPAVLTLDLDQVFTGLTLIED